MIEYQATTIAEVINLVLKISSNTKEPIWFRGQPNSEWTLQPPMFRLGKEIKENQYISDYLSKTRAHNDYRGYSEFDILMQMTLDGIPTRLLDWSENLMTSLFFAIFGNRNADGALFILFPIKLNKANTEMDGSESDKIPFIDIEDKRFKKYLPTYFIKNQVATLPPLAGLPLYPKKWIKDSGVGLVFFHNSKTLIETIDTDNEIVFKINIKRKAKAIMLENLRKMGLLPPSKDYILSDLRRELYEK